MKIDKLFAGLNISAQGLTAQRKRMNAIASNMANVETTKTDNGQPYRRKIVTQKACAQQTFSRVLQSSNSMLATTNANHIATGEEGTAQEVIPGGVVSKDAEDQSPFKMVYDPSHPDANENGYVQMPNVNIVTEMTDMVTASRAYEANVTAANAAKSIAKDALEI
jgi:flagellar basal-body rod protein FlgC